MKSMDVPTERAREAFAEDRVRGSSADRLNRLVDLETQRCLEELASADRDTISQHIGALDREWDVERYLQTNAAIASLAGVALGAAVNRRFLLLPGVVFGFFLQHAIQGWCPPLPLFRRMGIRTRREINREKYALKVLRGDFETIGPLAGREQPR
ncbi:MAG TPA: hypothetical protein VD833_04970 [Vicinamibacterales bacterium]|nr:hypothetical protein [Vicinamibacterales bacterium]